VASIICCPCFGENTHKKDDMSDEEAIGIIEKTLHIHMSPTAARAISMGLLDIGVDTPAKLRRLVLVEPDR
jgi:hypothetical protein